MMGQYDADGEYGGEITGVSNARAAAEEGKLRGGSEYCELEHRPFTVMPPSEVQEHELRDENRWARKLFDKFHQAMREAREVYGPDVRVILTVTSCVGCNFEAWVIPEPNIYGASGDDRPADAVAWRDGVHRRR